MNRPDFVQYACIDFEGLHLMSDKNDSCLYNVKLTFDGNAETGWELKNVEMINHEAKHTITTT